MVQSTHKERGERGFTLVELMTVVAIVSLLACLAIPNYFHARQRAQAVTIIEEARMLDSARDHYSIETSVSSTAPIGWSDILPYLKTGSRLATSNGKDLYGNDYAFSPMNTPVTVAAATIASFDTEIVSSALWGNYSGANNGSGN